MKKKRLKHIGWTARFHAENPVRGFEYAEIWPTKLGAGKDAVKVYAEVEE